MISRGTDGTTSRFRVAPRRVRATTTTVLAGMAACLVVLSNLWGCGSDGVPVVIDTRAVGQATALTASFGEQNLKVARVRDNLWIVMGIRCGDGAKPLSLKATGTIPTAYEFKALDVCGATQRIRLHLMADGSVARHLDAPVSAPTVN